MQNIQGKYHYNVEEFFQINSGSQGLHFMRFIAGWQAAQRYFLETVTNHCGG